MAPTMARTIRRPLVGAATLVAVVLLAIPAGAKGITSAHFTGSGLPRGGLTIPGDHPQLFDSGLFTNGTGVTPWQHGLTWKSSKWTAWS